MRLKNSPAEWDAKSNTYKKENEARGNFVDTSCKLLNYATSDSSASFLYRCIMQFNDLYSKHPMTQEKLNGFSAADVLEQLEKLDTLRSSIVAASKRTGDVDDDSHLAHGENSYFAKTILLKRFHHVSNAKVNGISSKILLGFSNCSR